MLVLDVTQLRNVTLNDEALMRAGRPGGVGEEPRDRAFRRDFDPRLVRGERPLHRGIPADGRAAARREHGGDEDGANGDHRGHDDFNARQHAACELSVRRR